VPRATAHSCRWKKKSVGLLRRAQIAIVDQHVIARGGFARASYLVLCATRRFGRRERRSPIARRKKKGIEAARQGVENSARGCGWARRDRIGGRVSPTSVCVGSAGVLTRKQIFSNAAIDRRSPG